MSRPDYQLRVIEEKAALDVKLAALTKFLGSSACGNVDAAEVTRLQLQHACMERYSAVLGERIATWGPA